MEPIGELGLAEFIMKVLRPPAIDIEIGTEKSESAAIRLPVRGPAIPLSRGIIISSAAGFHLALAMMSNENRGT